MAKEKEHKTNAMRELDRAHITYRADNYEVSDELESEGHALGVKIANLTGHDPNTSFKTLVTQAPDKSLVTCVIPVAMELDLKKAAAAVDEKNLHLVSVKDIEQLTGYVRGGVSPIGLKKPGRTIVDETALLWDEIGISGGRRGSTLMLAPQDLIDFCHAVAVDITR